jgi:hypothetical protein
VHHVRALLGPTGTVATGTLIRSTSARSVARWIDTGRLVRLHPGWVTVPELADDWTVRAHAATGYTGGALSHMSALAVHGIVDHEVTRLDVLVRRDRRVRSSRWLRIHRTDAPFGIVAARGIRATPAPRSLVDTWGDAHSRRAMRGFDGVARGAALRAVREKRVSVRELAMELSRRPELPGRGRLLQLLGLLAAGCQSELEIFAVLHVLAIPDLPRCRQQFRVDLAHGPVRLDAAWPEVKLAVELDGAAFHGSPDARERDLRRDAALAAQGWLVLRFSYRRLKREPAACRAEILAAYRQRLSMVP